MVTTAGRHEISVLAGGEPVAGSPFALEVAPGQLHPGSCSLSGAGVRSVQLGREMQLEVRLADCFGNSIADAGCIEAHDVQVRAQPGQGDKTELVMQAYLDDSAWALPARLPGIQSSYIRHACLEWCTHSCGMLSR